MRRDFWVVLAIAVALLLPFAGAGSLSASNTGSIVPSDPPTGRVMSGAEVLAVREEWALSRHGDTYDDGQGANTTCARCKSPRNWDASAPAAAQAQDCASCKRAPGAARPDLEGGMTISRGDWRGITCDVCHQPAGDSYYTSVAYWNQALGAYEPVGSVMELCARCHEGKHGFEVVEEQEASVAHRGWDCTKCHGPHGKTSRCVDCHDPATGKGTREHGLHANVNCTGCHDAGSLDIWQDREAGSRHQGEFIAVRFAHALTSWSSHNLKLQVDCKRCHHPLGQTAPALDANTGCRNAACHPEGAAMNWCPAQERDPMPRQLRWP